METLATRFSHSVGKAHGGGNASAPCMLVRIYPVAGVEEPIELTAEPQLVGRDVLCSLQLNDDSVSRRHAILERVDDKCLVADLNSTNGTYVNEQRITGSHALAAGDRVRFGNQIFKFLSADGIEAQYHEVVFKMMTTDGLTGAYNKRYFLETLERELQQSRRSVSPLCVMMLDLDKFKAVNDTHGHLAGDAVLVEFARRAQGVLRSGELLARYGGEEFIMLLTRTSLEEAVQVAERVRQAISAAPVSFANKSIPVTVSIGVSCFNGRLHTSATQLLAQADELLYEAKRKGRNRVQSQLGN